MLSQQIQNIFFNLTFPYNDIIACLSYLDSLDQLSLILSNGASDVRSNEEGVETAEDAEHLVGILGGAQLKLKQV